MSGGDDSTSNSSTEFSMLRWMTAPASVLSGAAAQGVTALWHASKPARLAAPASVQALFSGVTRLAWVNSRGSKSERSDWKQREGLYSLRGMRVMLPAVIEGLSHAALVHGVGLLRSAGYIDEEAVVPLQCSSSLIAYLLGQITHEQLERRLAVTDNKVVDDEDIEAGGAKHPGYGTFWQGRTLTMMPQELAKEYPVRDEQTFADEEQKIQHWLRLLKAALQHYAMFKSRKHYIAAHPHEKPLDTLWLEYLLLAGDSPIELISQLQPAKLKPDKAQQYIEAIDVALTASAAARYDR